MRSARLLLDAELTAGELAPQDVLRARGMRAVVRSRPIPPRPLRVAQQVLRKLGRLDYERAVVAPLHAARRATLGGEGAGRPPRFLVRVDEFPHYLAWDDPDRYGTERFRRFHEIMASAGVPYLVAVPPRISHAPLDPQERSWRALNEAERALLDELRAAPGVAFALHGRDHRTRFASPRQRSELSGLGAEATAELLDGALAELAELGVGTEIFVPPFNRFDAAQYDALAQRFAVVCGGPESIGMLGFQRTPMWRGEAVYLPSYFPLYGHAHEVLPAARALIEERCGLWTPIALHWGWEADAGWAQLEQLAATIAPYTASWEDFLAAVRRSAGS